MACGGKRHAYCPLFYEATALTDIPRTAKILSEETFGQGAAVLAFDNQEDVTAYANVTVYGRIGYIHTQDTRHIYQLCRARRSPSAV